MIEWLLLATSLALIAICGLFVAGEFALLAADRPTIERAAAAGDRAAAGVLTAFRSLSTQLSSVQLAITLTNLAVGFLSEPALAGLLHSPLRGIGIPESGLEAVAVILAMVISTVLTLLFGELVPKNLAISLPERVARAVQAPVRAFTSAMRWPIAAMNRCADAVLSLFGLRAQEELASARAPDELVSLVRHSAQEGTLTPATATLLVASLRLGERRAGQVMTPRPRMTTVPATASVAELLQAVHRSGHARLPVTGAGGLDEIAGIADLDGAIAVPAAQRARTPVTAVMSPALEVPETLPLSGVLGRLQDSRNQLAVVVDEYGGTAGLVTGEDLLEELVGELDDEHDEPATPARRTGDGWDVSGLLRPDELASFTGHRLLARGPYDTLGGLLMRALGRIPTVGDTVTAEGLLLRVVRMDGRRVDRILVTAPADGDSRE